SAHVRASGSLGARARAQSAARGRALLAAALRHRSIDHRHHAVARVPERRRNPRSTTADRAPLPRGHAMTRRRRKGFAALAPPVPTTTTTTTPTTAPEPPLTSLWSRYWFGPIAAIRPFLLMRGFLLLVAFDTWCQMIAHGARYGIGGFNVA